MQWIDWIIIGGYILLVTGIGLLFVRRGSGSVAEYFVAGRNLPWWLAGTSLIATSFAADTPLFVAGLVATKGIAGNWLWWNQVLAWSLAMVLFARLWRRSGVITDAEFIELRYGGNSGAFLRGFRACYMSLIFSTCTVAWVMLAMQKIVQATIEQPAWIAHLQLSIEQSLGMPSGSIDVWKTTVLIGAFCVAALYTVVSGLWGIVAVDFVQFFVAVGGSILFAVFAVNSVGGMTELRVKLLAEYGPERVQNIYSFLPAYDSPWMPVTTFAVYLSVLWWGDCNGFAAQRMFSTRTERDSVLTAIWYSIAHFALRPWPWILVGMVAMIYYPNLADPESGYPKLMSEILPTGFHGLVIASLLAAFMSTVDTHLNWNASYFVTDIYKRFLNPTASEKQSVRVSRLAVIAFAALAITVAYFMTSIEQGVLILFNLQAGIGMVLMLRWFWWRINAWSEISAMIASLIVTSMLPIIDHWYGFGWTAATRIVLTVLLVTPIWVAATLLTAPANATQLLVFYRLVRPPRAFWGPIAAQCPDVSSDGSLSRTLVAWVGGVIAIYSLLFAVGKLVLLEFVESAWAAGICLIVAYLLRLLYAGSRSPMAK